MEFTLDHLKKMYSYGRIVSADKEALAEMQNMFEWAVHEIEGKESEYQATIDKYHMASKLAREYQAENNRFRAALKWYADKENYTFPETGDYKVSDPEVLDDKGQRAREALKGSP